MHFMKYLSNYLKQKGRTTKTTIIPSGAERRKEERREERKNGSKRERERSGGREGAGRRGPANPAAYVTGGLRSARACKYTLLIDTRILIISSDEM